MRAKKQALIANSTSTTSQIIILRLWWFLFMTIKQLNSNRCWVRSTLQSLLNKTQRSWPRSISKMSFYSTSSQRMLRFFQSMSITKAHQSILKSSSLREQLARMRLSFPLSALSRKSRISSIKISKSLFLPLRSYLRKNIKHGLTVFHLHTMGKKKMEF